MRESLCIAAFAVIFLGSFFPCFAQQPTGPQTLETLLQQAEEPQQPQEDPTAKAEPATPHTQGTYVRPEEGVQHPDLDKTWATYDYAVTQANASITTVLTQLFDAAADKGDLDAADKWQTLRDKFQKEGVLPDEKQVQAAVKAAVQGIKSANDELRNAYDQLVKSLTKEKKIAEAKAVRDEWKAFEAGSGPAVVAAAPQGSPVKDEPKARIPADAMKFRGHAYYLFVEPKVDQQTAKAKCEELGGQLVRIETADEWAAILQMLTLAKSGGRLQTFAIWIDGTDFAREGVWVFADGTPMKFFAWLPGEPNGGPRENVMQVLSHSLKWNDGTADRQYPFICEWVIRPEPKGKAEAAKPKVKPSERP